MTTVYVQFADSTKATIVAAFSCPQDAESWPNQGTVTDADPKWAAYYSTIPAGAQPAWPKPTN